jgi:hypothetical protein
MIASRSKHDGFRGEQDEDSRKRDLTMPLKRFLGPRIFAASSRVFEVSSVE